MDLVKSPQLPRHVVDKYEREAGRYWDLFYRRNENRFFKDRHWFESEFPQLLRARTVLEVGCGVGNTVFPLLTLNPSAFVYCCDFAPSAVALVRSHPDYAASQQVHAFVADITRAAGGSSSSSIDESALRTLNDSSSSSSSSGASGSSSSSSGSSENGASKAGCLATEVPAGCVDACTMVFVLSAISPLLMPQAIRNVARCLKPGTGQVLFRDYAAGDLAQERLAEAGRQQRIGENFYARWDGTRAFYFTEEGLRALFAAEGFTCEYVLTHRPVVENRKKGEAMHRRYLQAVFTYVGGSSSASGAQQQGLRQGSVSEEDGGREAEGPSPAREAAAGEAGSNGTAQDGVEVPLGPVTFTLRGSQPSPAELCLARLLLASPSLLRQRSLLELGSPWQHPTGLPSLAALRWCRFAVATATSRGALEAVRCNARCNAPLVVIERLRLQPLDWQEAGSGLGAGPEAAAPTAAAAATEQLAAVRRAFPQGFGVLAGADLLRCEQDAGALARQLAALLAEAPHAVALLCQGGGGSGSSGTELPGADCPAGLLKSVAAAAAPLGLQEAPLPTEAACAWNEARAAAGCGGVEVLCLCRPQ